MPVNITIILTAYVPADSPELAKKLINESKFQPRAVFVDDRQTEYSMGYASVQAYYHIRPEHEQLFDKIAEHQTQLQEVQQRIRKRIDASQFVAFAEHWLIPENSKAKNGFPFQPSKSESDSALHANLSNNSTAKVLFVSRPELEAELTKSVTLVEVPESTPEGDALGLAFHDQLALDTPLVILDLLAAKASWLAEKIAVSSHAPFSNEIESRWNVTFDSTTQLLDKLRQSAADTETSLEFSRLHFETHIFVASIKLNSLMLGFVRNQIEQFHLSLNDYGLSCMPGWQYPNTFPVRDSLGIISASEEQYQKYIKLFEEILTITDEGGKYNTAVAIENTAHEQRLTTDKFNRLTVLLGMAAVLVSLVSIVDTETAKEILGDSPDKPVSALAALGLKLFGIVAVILLTVAGIFIKQQVTKKTSAVK